LRVSETVIA